MVATPGSLGLEAPAASEGVRHDARAFVTSLGAPRIDGPARVEAAVSAWEAHLAPSVLAPVRELLTKVDAPAQQSALAAMAALGQPRRDSAPLAVQRGGSNV